ncbi:MAG TPA: hydroxyethylthiazole kinase [Rectinemataceae bacterium]|nr:hydroxyethylthiazole kinase [Rectinemataceae bacterium]
MATTNNDFGRAAAGVLESVRSSSPLVHQITNFVVMNDTANLTLAIGALPVMAHAREEVADMVGAAGSLVLNPGTLEPAWVEAMILAGKRANELGVPIVFDPVGVGATPYRNETGARILRELKLTVIRGNSGEIGALAGAGGEVRGVESVTGVADPAKVVRELAARTGAVVVITGKRDYLSDGKRILGVDNGHEMMKNVTGTGCMSTAMIGAFVATCRNGKTAAEKDPLAAAAAALACYGLAGEIAASKARGPGSFRMELMDALFGLNRAAVEKGARIVEL